MSPTRASVMFINGSPFLVISTMNGANTYMRVTCALSAAEMLDLAGRLSAAAATVAATAAEVTRPSCRVCLKDCDECVCALRAATAKAQKDAESKQCMTCRVWTRVCCKLHREPVRS